MVFSSLFFLFLFLPIVIFLYFISKDKYKNYILLIASLFFYAWGEPIYVIIMIFSIICNYLFGISVNFDKKKRKVYLILSIIFNLSMLCIFKYTNFFVYNINRLFNIDINIPEIALPLGISFFTFQSMSYVIDVYRGDAIVQKKLTNLALYISLFPQLVAGPIVRYTTIMDQIDDRKHTLDKFSNGVIRFIIGLAKKVMISNTLGQLADSAFLLTGNDLSVVSAWLGVIAYSLQIYFDFSGYSDMAIGLGEMFGFEFLENFNYPYISQSASEFWRRWHISLGSWFRDYVYIPLGGSRKGIIRTYLNLFIVWFLTGFWHGANWTFIAWGLYFGVLISIEKSYFERILFKLYKPIRHIYLLIVVMVGWVFFRSDNFNMAFKYIKSMFKISDCPIYDNTSIIFINDYGFIIILAIILSTPIIKILSQKIKFIRENTFIYIIKSLVISFMFFIVIMELVNSTYNPFLYFRF